MIQEIIIEPEYAVFDSGTSDGTQIKFYTNSKWYKLDRYGGEGEAEFLASKIMELSGYPEEKFVSYRQMCINGESGCVSEDFLEDNESFITVYRLYMNSTGRDLMTVTSRMDYDDAIEFVLSFIKDVTDLDFREYLADTFALDSLILNEDRHFNNMGVIFDGEVFKTAPIFDNGKSLRVGRESKEQIFAKAFSGDFRQNRKYLNEYATLKPDKESILDFLNENRNKISSKAYNTLVERLKNY